MIGLGFWGQGLPIYSLELWLLGLCSELFNECLSLCVSVLVPLDRGI